MSQVIVLNMEQLHNQQLTPEPFLHLSFQALRSVALEQLVSSAGSRCGRLRECEELEPSRKHVSPIAAHALEKFVPNRDMISEH